MKKLYIASIPILFSISASCQDCTVADRTSLTEVKSAVIRFTTEHLYTGWDTKTWNRSGDLVAVAIVKTIPVDQTISPDTLRDVLFILHEAWACPSRCIADSSDRQPNVTLLLLEHLRANNHGQMQSEIDDTKQFIFEQIRTSK